METVTAGPAIRAGYPEGLSYYLGKVLECASFNAEPYAGKETVIGEITHEDVKVTAMSPYQRCTPASVAGHAMGQLQVSFVNNTNSLKLHAGYKTSIFTSEQHVTSSTQYQMLSVEE